MTRVPQSEGNRGSLKWIQRLVNSRPDLISDRIVVDAKLETNDQIRWLSPLASDDYAEYRDSAFLERLNITVDQRPLQQYWPRRGPQWDALGKITSGKVLIVEAKAHVGELVSAGTQSSGKSRDLIVASLEEAKSFLRVPARADWTGPFYQYANRLAHLYLLRTLNAVDAYLVFVYFLNDEEMNGPRSIREWQAAVKTLEASLGLRRHPLSRYVIDVFVDVAEL